eukprot:8007193-Heterocapsa_arctica.AAC.1
MCIRDRSRTEWSGASVCLRGAGGQQGSCAGCSPAASPGASVCLRGAEARQSSRAGGRRAERSGASVCLQ